MVRATVSLGPTASRNLIQTSWTPSRTCPFARPGSYFNAKLIGTCALWRINAQNRRAEIGYILDSRAWGHGYMHEALSALLDYAFTELKLNRVEADTDPRNERSARLLDRLRFSKEGLFRERCIVDGKISDAAMYGLLRREWIQHRQQPGPQG